MRNFLYVSLPVAEQNKLNFFFCNDHNTQDITQVNNLAVQNKPNFHNELCCTLRN